MPRPHLGKSCLASRGPAAGQSMRWIIGENRADHEDRRAPKDNRKRNPVQFAIERKADELDSVGKWIELANIIENRTAFLNPPKRIKGRWSKENRKDHEVHHAGEI